MLPINHLSSAPPAPLPRLHGVLVVGAHLSVRKALERLLEPYGVGVQGAAGGADALRVLTRQPDLLVLLDPQVQDADGAPLCRRLIREGRQVLLLMPDQQAPSGACPEQGALDVLRMPLEPQRVLDTLTRHLQLDQQAPRLEPLQPSALLARLLHGGAPRPGLLGAWLLSPAGPVLEALGEGLTPDLLVTLNRMARDLGQTVQAQDGAPRSLVLEYSQRCVLLVPEPDWHGPLLACLLKDASYASLIRYWLQAKA
ncbi:hypothetical protein [Deinococcus sonorensis]|uniref:Response regulatory domain-containing protein n=2 Tax=Deinococcus sonorensis TaxID=309891 RepID=A0AAU7UES7_9DEIO